MKDKFDEMGKNELRAACQDAGIQYSKLSTQAQREALRSIEKASAPKDEIVAPPVVMQTAAPVADEEDEVIQAPVPNGLSAFVSQMTGEKAPVADIKATKATATKRMVSVSKIEKDRMEQNGIKRPSMGGLCRAIWDELDLYRDVNGTIPSSKEVKAMAERHLWNRNNASIEFYQWRRFHGITGRAKKGE